MSDPAPAKTLQIGDVHRSFTDTLLTVEAITGPPDGLQWLTMRDPASGGSMTFFLNDAAKWLALEEKALPEGSA